MIRNFLESVEEEDLFPGRIGIYEKLKVKGKIKTDLLEPVITRKLNQRKNNLLFMSRVLKRFKDLSFDRTKLNTSLEKFIKVLQEKGVETDNGQIIINEEALKEVCGLTTEEYKTTLKHGIESLCLQKQDKNGQIRIILISAELEKDEEPKLITKRSICRKIFRIVKLHGVENEKQEIACKEEVVRREIKVSDEEFTSAMEFCTEQGYIRTYKGKKKTYIMLLKEDFPKEVSPGVEKIKKKVIKFIKNSKDETEEGFLCITEEKLVEVLEISKTKLAKVVQHGLKEELLKFDEIKKVKFVVYTQDRRLDLANHI